MVVLVMCLVVMLNIFQVYNMVVSNWKQSERRSGFFAIVLIVSVSC